MDQKLTGVKRLHGRLRVPSDKSLTHRALLISALAKGVSTIKNPLLAEDCLSTAGCLEQLGLEIDKDGSHWTVKGLGLWGFKKPLHPLQCGNSGTTMRLISGIMAAQDFSSTLLGDVSLSQRPMDRVAKPLQSMGAKFVLVDGKFAPIKITGSRSLIPIDWKNPVASAQVKSAVLLAGLHARGETSYEEPFLSRDHTERMLAAVGVKIARQGNRVSVQGPASLEPQSWVIPGDFSSAAFFIVAGLLVEASDVTLEAVNLNSTRTGLLKVLAEMGARIDVQSQERGGEPIGDITIKGRASLRGGSVHKEISPHLIDEIPILAVAATQAQGTTEIRGVEELRFKETNRIAAVFKNLTAMGAQIKLIDDGLIIEGPTKLKGTQVESYDDHRIAMAMAVAALIAEGETVIKNADCVAISFPAFWEALWRLTGK